MSFGKLQLNWGIKRRWWQMQQKVQYWWQLGLWWSDYWKARVFAQWYFPNFVVQSGPFKGLRYPRYPDFQEIFSTFVPKLAGNYERELHPIIRRLQKQSFMTVVNIGSDDGYYAVGLAQSQPQAQLVFFEPNLSAGRYGLLLAQANGLKRSDAHWEKNPTPKKLQKVLHKASLVICDCEGAELDYIDVQTVPALKKTTLVIEVHDAINPIISQTLKKRLTKTHDIKVVSAKLPGKYGTLYQDMISNEKRAAAVFWLYCQPRKSS